MDLKQKRLEDYRMTQLIPINILEERDKRRLSTVLNLFKICKSFPKEEIGKFKKIQKEIEKCPLALIETGKSYDALTEYEKMDLSRLLNRRASTPCRKSPYIKFLMKSIIASAGENVEFATYTEEVYESWVFSVGNDRYDLTINDHKILVNNCIYIDPSCVLDEKNMIKKDCVLNMAAKIPIALNQNKVMEINDSINKVIDIYNNLYMNSGELK